MQWTKLGRSLALVLVAYASTACGWCSNGICTATELCRKENAWNGKPSVKCHLQGQTEGVCCSREKLTLSCTTSGEGRGKCMQESRCMDSTITRAINGTDPHNDWKRQLCFRTKRTKHYCCPIETQKQEPMESQRGYISSLFNDNEYPSCSTWLAKAGKCVPLAQCDVLHTWQKRKTAAGGYETVDAKFKCGSDASGGNSTSVCCPIPVQEEQQNLIQHKQARKLNLNSCGRISLQNRVTEDVAAGQYPWMANLMYYQKSKKVSLCSGSLIHRRYVLTAAHCSQNATKPIAVRLGEHDFSTSVDCAENVCAGPIREYAIANWIPHEKYTSRDNRQYDIALVQLERDAMIVPGQIYPICLPTTKQWLMMKPSKLTVSGWGCSDVLQESTQSTVCNRTEELCHREGIICTGKGATVNDGFAVESGGPWQQARRYGRLFRMVLFGVNLGDGLSCLSPEDRAQPTAMVMVAYHMDWILDNLRI